VSIFALLVLALISGQTQHLPDGRPLHSVPLTSILDHQTRSQVDDYADQSWQSRLGCRRDRN
jgi:hypothetical protein